MFHVIRGYIADWTTVLNSRIVPVWLLCMLTDRSAQRNVLITRTPAKRWWQLSRARLCRWSLLYSAHLLIICLTIRRLTYQLTGVRLFSAA